MSSLPVTKAPDVAPPSPEANSAVGRIILVDQGIEVPASALTLEGFRAWARSDAFPERGSISFINQELFIDMSPEELETHNKVKSEMGRVLGNLNKKRKLGDFYSDGALLTNVAANLSTEPDATFVSWPCLDAGRVQLIPREGAQGEFIEIEGTPDWVMEIISKSSVQKDVQRLRERYYRAGIPEYWLINARGETIDFLILVHGATDYVTASGRGGWQQSPLFGCQFRLVRERGPRNFWDYTLQMKPLR